MSFKGPTFVVLQVPCHKRFHMNDQFNMLVVEVQDQRQAFGLTP